MRYKQFDREGNLVSNQDLQNKALWCKKGETIEAAFVSKYGERLEVSINPAKQSNPYAPDLFTPKGVADLKTQNTPFFKAESLFGINPSYAVVFNRKDFERYELKYPQIDVYFWVEWHSVAFEMGEFRQEVEFVSGVWFIPFDKLVDVLSRSKEHSYSQRVHDRRGNAKSSFVFDIRESEFTRKC